MWQEISTFLMVCGLVGDSFVRTIQTISGRTGRSCRKSGKRSGRTGKAKAGFSWSLPLRNFQDCTAAGRRNLTCHTGLLGGEPRGKFVRRNCSSSSLGHGDNSASGVRQEDDHAFLCLSNGGNTPFIGKYHLQPFAPRRSNPSRFNFCAHNYVYVIL